MRFACRVFLVCACLPPLLGSASLFAQRESVKPGINDSFKNPDVKQFVERFEREGREVYDERLEIVSNCGIRSGMAVADVGAGTGLFTRLFAERVGDSGRVYAVDIAESFVRGIEEFAKENNLRNIVGVLCTATSAKLPADSVDLVFICDTYHHFEYPQRTMRSIKRAMRSGGRLIVIDFVREEGVSSDWILNHVRAGKATVIKEIEAAGFKLSGELSLLKDNYVLQFEKTGGKSQRRGRKKADSQ